MLSGSTMTCRCRGPCCDQDDDDQGEDDDEKEDHHMVGCQNGGVVLVPSIMRPITLRVPQKRLQKLITTHMFDCAVTS